MYHYDLSISSADVFGEELEAIVIPYDDTATVIHINVSDIFQVVDPKLFCLYDEGKKCTVITNFHLFCKFHPFCNIKWYDNWFRSVCKMKGATSEQTIVPKAERYLQVTTIQEWKSIELLCYYSFKFTSMLLSDSITLNRSNHVKEYSEQLMTELFDEEEISNMSEDLQGEIQQQASNSSVSQFMEYSHKGKQNRNTLSMLVFATQ